MRKSKITKLKHLIDRETKMNCPNCKNEDSLDSLDFGFDEDSAYQNWNCDNCGHNWEMLFNLREVIIITKGVN
jgi:transcription elongation factor Elf1